MKPPSIEQNIENSDENNKSYFGKSLETCKRLEKTLDNFTSIFPPDYDENKKWLPHGLRGKVSEIVDEVEKSTYSEIFYSLGEDLIKHAESQIDRPEFKKVYAELVRKYLDAQTKMKIVQDTLWKFYEDKRKIKEYFEEADSGLKELEESGISVMKDDAIKSFASMYKLCNLLKGDLKKLSTSLKELEKIEKMAKKSI